MASDDVPQSGQFDLSAYLDDRLVGPLRAGGDMATGGVVGAPRYDQHSPHAIGDPDTMLSPVVRTTNNNVPTGPVPLAAVPLVNTSSSPTGRLSPTGRSPVGSPRNAEGSWSAAQRAAAYAPEEKIGRLSFEARAMQRENVHPDPSYGPRLARAFDDLKGENRWLKQKYESALRQAGRSEAAGAKGIMLSSRTGLREAMNSCACSDVLRAVLEVVEGRFESYERVNWQRRIELAEAERDELAIRSSIAAERLAQLEARILSDPFHATLLSDTAAATPLAGIMQRHSQMMTGTGGAPNPRHNQELMRALKDAYRRIALAEEVNDQLERRLVFEKSMARAWQPDLKAMQGQLRDYLSQLDQMVKLQQKSIRKRAGRSTSRDDLSRRHHRSVSPGSEHSCALLGAVGLMDMHAPNLSGGAVSRTERESLRLLRMAKERIEADDRRLTVFSHRVKELEHEVADLRVRLMEEASGRRAVVKGARVAA